MSSRWDKWIAKVIAKSGLLSAIERLEAGRSNMLRILAYHRIGTLETESGLLNPGLLNARPEMFIQQMRFLREHYCLISLDDFLCSLATKQPLPPRSVMVTFDDGYRDFLDSAWPILLQFNVPAILFVATNYLSPGKRPFWWDQLYQAFSQTRHIALSLPGVGSWSLCNPEKRRKALLEVENHIMHTNHHKAMALVEQIVESLEVPSESRDSMLTWEDVRHLSARGLTIGAHTQSHPILSRITPGEARQEIIGSQQDLARELNHTWPVFAYPCGHQADICPELMLILHEAGFKAAMTLIEGHNVMGRTPPLCLKRVGMASHLSMAEFRLVLTGVYNIYGMLLKFLYLWGQTRRCL